MTKILTPLNMGWFVLAHRMVVAGSAAPMVRIEDPSSSIGGMFIQPFRSCGSKAGPESARPSMATKAWLKINQAIRRAGGISVARIACHGDWAEPTNIAGFSKVLGLAQEAEFDGVELGLLTSAQPSTSILEKVQVLLDVWSAERVGIYLAPFSWLRSPEDESTARHFGALLSGLNDMDVAFAHFAGALAVGYGDLSFSALGRELRAGFHGIVLASGDYTVAEAIAAVEGRWADAIVFPSLAGDELAFMSALKAAARRAI